MSWKAQRLNECVKFLSGGTPNKGKPEFWDGEIPWVSSAEMTERFLNDTSLRISQAGLDAGSRLVPAGTTFAVVRGMSLAKEFRISLAQRSMAFNQDVKALIPKSGFDGRFIFYSLSAHAKAIRDLATEAAHGTKKLEMDRLENYVIDVPDDIETQRIVASVAYAYDDLIATNQRRIALLEDAARRLYREWFVHLRFPGHESVPVKDGVPEGWSQGSAYDFISILSGGTPKTGVEHYWGGDIPFFTPKDSPDAFYVIGTEKTLTESGLASCNSRLFAKNTTFITARGTVGKVALAQKPMAMNQSCYALVPKQDYDNLFLFAAIKNAVEHFKQVAVGGVFDAIIVDTFKVIPFVLPDTAVTQAFGNAVRPLFQQVETLLLQNMQLARARDLLLPKLMSGQLDVSGIRLPDEVAA